MNNLRYLSRNRLQDCQQVVAKWSAAAKQESGPRRVRELQSQGLFATDVQPGDMKQVVPIAGHHVVSDKIELAPKLFKLDV